MPKLSDVAASQRERLESLECPTVENSVFAPPRALNDCKVALISSAGLMSRHDDNVRGGTGDYRSFPNAVTDRDLLVNHVSVNFDRSGFAEDANTVLPRERLRQLATDGKIGSAATEHYAFMGATHPEKMQQNVARLVTQLKDNKVNAACLLPV